MTTFLKNILRACSTSILFAAILLSVVAPGDSLAQSDEAFARDINQALAQLKPMMVDSVVPALQRVGAEDIGKKLLKKYPDFAPAHKLMGLIYMATRQGDKALAEANLACTVDPSACESGKKWATDIEEAFSKCIDYLSDVDACALMHSSPEMLTLFLKDKYFTSRGDQHFIGKIVKFEKSLLHVQVTWSNAKSPFAEGSIQKLKINETMKLRTVSPEAEKDGWH